MLMHVIKYYTYGFLTTSLLLYSDSCPVGIPHRWEMAKLPSGEWPVGQKTLFQYLTHHMLTYFTNHNHLKTLLIIKKQPIYEVLTCKLCFGKSDITVL